MPTKSIADKFFVSSPTFLSDISTTMLSEMSENSGHALAKIATNARCEAQEVTVTVTRSEVPTVSNVTLKKHPPCHGFHLAPSSPFCATTEPA
jgi:hypothetical protein